MANHMPLITVLSVSPFRRDHEFLGTILSGSKWRLLCAQDCREAWQILHQVPVGVVLVERSFPDGLGWRHLLEETTSMKEAPPVIVAAREVDDALWAEVLGAGAFDLLAKPFDPLEVRRAISQCWRNREDVRILRTRLNPPTGKTAAAAI
jgi:DNA-binding response OmpR family regulator